MIIWKCRIQYQPVHSSCSAKPTTCTFRIYYWVDLWVSFVKSVICRIREITNLLHLLTVRNCQCGIYHCVDTKRKPKQIELDENQFCALSYQYISCFNNFYFLAHFYHFRSVIFESIKLGMQRFS